MMGSSLVRALKKHDVAKQVIVIVRKSQYIKTLESQNIDATEDYKVIKDADLVVVCTNLNSYKEVIRQVNQYCTSKTIISDIGSVKEMPEQQFANSYKYPANFVPAHPIAGSEKSGFGIAIDNLYSGKKVVITKKTKNANLVASMYKAIGMKVEYLKSDIHDQIYAEMSHLPQLLAFESRYIADSFAGELKSATNFHIEKFLRLTKSDPVMWDEIFFHNMHRIVDLVSLYRENYQSNVSHETFLIKLMQYRSLLSSFDQLNEAEPLLVDVEPIQQIIVAYLDSINHDNIKYAGTGFKDFIQPLFL